MFGDELKAILIGGIIGLCIGGLVGSAMGGGWGGIVGSGVGFIVGGLTLGILNVGARALDQPAEEGVSDEKADEKASDDTDS